ncbi:MAG: sulfatase-like hydrolase/transferase [Planctomycetes bacterium]|nr:sulfatase-like hydrolase/transferase [Planctomycetota bacterium]
MAATVLLLVGCQPGPARNTDSGGLNVLLITLDTTRADHLGCYGNPQAATPNLDRLAQRGVQFLQCTADVPITLPSHTSILTGLSACAHGVRDNGRYHLHENHTTLAEVLRQHGYQTCAYLAAVVLNAQYGLNQGFDEYHDVPIPSPATLDEAARESDQPPHLLMARYGERAADQVADLTIEYLRQNRRKRFFLWTHFFDPHLPYTAPPRWTRRYPQSGYVAEIAFMDEQVGRVLSELENLKLADRTLVVVTADHGEGLGQHHEDTHAFYVYDTTLAVPTIMACPQRFAGGRTVAAQVRNIDIVPTILDLLDLPPLDVIQGKSLLPLLRGDAADLHLEAHASSIITQLDFDYAPLHCLRAGGWKYIHADPPELYHVADDPNELRNLATTDPAKTLEMQERLRRVADSAPQFAYSSRAQTTIDPATAARLRAMGYVGGLSAELGHTPRSQPTTLVDELDWPGANPMEKWEVIQCLANGQSALQDQRYELAEQQLQRLLQLEPASPFGLHLLAQCYFFQDRIDEATAAVQRLLEARPHDARAHTMLGRCLVARQEYARAITAFERAIELRPDDFDTWFHLGAAHTKLESWPDAQAAYRRALELQPTSFDARYRRAECLAASGDHSAAVAEARRLVEDSPASAPAHYLLSRSLFQLGQYAECEKACSVLLDQDLRSARMFLLRAQCRAQLGNVSAAEADLDQAAALDPRIAPHIEQLRTRLRSAPLPTPSRP